MVAGRNHKIRVCHGQFRAARLQVALSIDHPKPRPDCASLDRGVMQIDSAHVAVAQIDINTSGTIGLLQAQAVSLNLKANTDISVLQDFDRDIFTSGKVALDAGVGGSLAKPLVNGTLGLQCRHQLQCLCADSRLCHACAERNAGFGSAGLE
jgi:hypothetical protein